MAISVIGKASASGSGSALAVTHGLTILSGDVVVAFLSEDGAGVTFTDNNGATPCTEAYTASTSDTSTASIWKRVAGASEPSAYAFTGSVSAGWSIEVRVFRGVDATVWDVAPSASTDDTGGSTTATAPSIDIVTAGALAIVMFEADSSSLTFSSVTNSFADLYGVAAGRVQATAIKEGLSAGALGSTAATLSASDTWIAIHMALKPAAGAAGLLIPIAYHYRAQQ